MWAINRGCGLSLGGVACADDGFCILCRYKMFADRLQLIGIETFLSCIDSLTELQHHSPHEKLQYTDVDDWRGRLINFITLSPTNSLDIEFDLPEKVLDTSNIQQQSGQEVID